MAAATIATSIRGDARRRHSDPHARPALRSPDRQPSHDLRHWFHTGDAVRRDASGMLYFVDRKKNIIRRSEGCPARAAGA